MKCQVCGSGTHGMLLKPRYDGKKICLECHHSHTLCTKCFELYPNTMIARHGLLAVCVGCHTNN